MSSVSYESAVLNAPIERVWALLRSMDQVWNPRVMSTRFGADFVIHTEPWAVGEVGVINYVDGTAQDVRLTELSDAHHRLSYELVSSVPPVAYSSAQHTITCRRVTNTGGAGAGAGSAQTFVEWETHFSRDADANVVADAGFKARDGLRALGVEANKRFTWYSTAEEVSAGFDLKGRKYVVTGGNSGIGFETVRVLALRGAHVVFTARDDAKIATTVAELKKLLPQTQANSVEGMRCELDDLKSVRAFAAAYIAKGYALHGLLLNAGVMAAPFGKTKQGFELQFGTNHIGHHLLTTLLLDTIVKSASATPGAEARIVAVSSAGHRITGIRLDDPNFLNRPHEYDPLLSYGQSKTANILFAKHLNQRLLKAGVKNVTANAIHPGVIHTNLGRHMGPIFQPNTKPATAAAEAKTPAQPAADAKAKDAKAVASDAAAAPAAWVNPQQTPAQRLQAMRPRFKTLAQGAATTLVAALQPEFGPYRDGGAAAGGGHYLVDCNAAPVMQPWAADLQVAEKLWDLTEKLIADSKA